jgi:hypothetical protein
MRRAREGGRAVRGKWSKSRAEKRNTGHVNMDFKRVQERIEESLARER